MGGGITKPAKMLHMMWNMFETIAAMPLANTRSITSCKAWKGTTRIFHRVDEDAVY